MMNQPQQPQYQYGGGFSQPPQQQQKGCWGRNWKWFVPAGCLGLILAIVGVGVGIFFIAMSALKSSEVYQEALRRAQNSPKVIEQLGEPVKDGWFVKGNVRVDGASGYADFVIPISGPKGKATIYAVATKESSHWMFDLLDVDVEGGTRFSLLERRDEDDTSLNEPPEGAVDENSNGDRYDSDEPPPAAPTPPKPASIVSGGILNGKATSLPQPPYPAIAKAARAEGTVNVQVVVDETGKVTSATAVSGHPLLRAAAEAAARQARFSPTLLSGNPVKVTGLITYNFKLE